MVGEGIKFIVFIFVYLGLVEYGEGGKYRVVSVKFIIVLVVGN